MKVYIIKLKTDLWFRWLTAYGNIREYSEREQFVYKLTKLPVNKKCIFVEF